MNKKPVLWRIIFALIVILVFGFSMYPLKPQDFMKIFKKHASLQNPGEKELKEYYQKHKDDFKVDGKEEPFKNVSDKIKQTIKDKNKNDLEKLINLTEKKITEEKIYGSQALEDAARELNIDLSRYVRVKNATGNKDIISFLRKACSGSIRLGIDLNGGAEFILDLEQKKADSKEEEKDIEENFDRYRDAAIEILRNRLESEKIFETEISPLGSKYISLKVPLVSKDEQLKLLKLIKMSARLQFCLVHKDNSSLVQQFQADPANFKCPSDYMIKELIEIKPGKKPEKHIYFVKIRHEMDGTDIEQAFPASDQYGQRYISLAFNSAGALRFGKVTRENVNRQLAIVLDGTLYSAPVIREAIEGGHAQITGDFSAEEAKQISTALVSGSLPVKINVEAVFNTDPTLGAEEVANGTKSGIIALIAVIIFMLIYYRRAGMAADISLCVNVILILGALAAFDATLTLPGIAGIILTIGMAVDANVLINERIREELRNNKTLPVAINAGFDRAFLTILDSNLTTLFTAFILMWQGTGPIKGFAVTLSIGILTSMFTALFISRLVFDIFAKVFDFRTMNMMSFFKETNLDFLGKKNIALFLSIALFIASVCVMIYRGADTFSIDFTGGTRVTYDYESRIPEQDILALLVQSGFPGAKVSYKSSVIDAKQNKKIEIVLRKKDVSNIQTDKGLKLEIKDILDKKFPNLKLGGGEESSIGGLIGWQFAKTAFIALTLATLGMILYISIRFEFAYAIAAIIADMHDIIIAAGIFVILGGEISLNVVAALLTILGYSVNDTIVVFDRIREDLSLIKNKSYKDIVNISINQTLSRTVMTTFTTLIVVVIMLLMGGIVIRDFLLVLFLGLIVGTYSSVFIASPIVSLWHKKSLADKIS